MYRIFLFALVAASPLAAQSSVEFTPTFGYRFGGTVNDSTGQFSAEDNAAWGATLGFRVKPDGLVQLVYSRQSTTIDFKPDLAGKYTVGDAAIEYIQIGGTLEFGHNPKTKPFFSMTVGGTHLSPKRDDLGSEWLFSFGGALGAKTYLNQHVGLSAQARIWMSTLSSNTEFWCSLPGYCVISASNGVFFTQGELTGGLIFVF